MRAQADLTPYRTASEQIVAVLSRHGGTVEKASIDEVRACVQAMRAWHAPAQNRPVSPCCVPSPPLLPCGSLLAFHSNMLT